MLQIERSIKSLQRSIETQSSSSSFQIHRGVNVTLSTSGDKQLDVASMKIYGQSPDKANTVLETMLCPSLSLGGRPNVKAVGTRFCPVGPHSLAQVFKADVQVGAIGTGEDVYMKICSDAAGKRCCENKLHHTLSSEWGKNKLEKWDRGDFDDCGDKTLFRVSGRLTRKEVTDYKMCFLF